MVWGPAAAESMRNLSDRAACGVFAESGACICATAARNFGGHVRRTTQGGNACGERQRERLSNTWAKIAWYG